MTISRITSNSIDDTLLSDEIGTLQQFYKSDFITPDATVPDSTYLLADGSVVSQATYTDLFAKVGLQPDGLDYFEQVATLTQPWRFHYGESLYLAAGATGALATSTDAISWTTRTSGVATQINALTSGNSVYVFGANGGLLRTSTDGVTWTARTSGSATTVHITALTFGDNLYVYGNNIGAIRSSTNGITWTARTSGTTFKIDALAFGGGLFAYGDYNGNIRTSTDAITWDARTSGLDAGQIIVGMVYGDGIFVAAAPYAQATVTSTDGITWTVNDVGFFAAWPAYSDGIYLARDGEGTGALCTSTDAVNWTMRPGYSWYQPGAGDGMYMVGTYRAGGGPDAISSTTKYTYNIATEFALPLAPRDAGGSYGPSLLADKQQAVYIKATT